MKEMKAAWFAVPVGVVLAFAGGLLYYLADQPKPPSLLEVSSEPRHPVTDAMIKLTADRAAKQIETSKGPTTARHEFTFAPKGATKPQFIYFVKDGCPCSYDAEPLFKRLGLKYAHSVEFATVTDAALDHAKAWDIAQTPPYPVVYDPDHRIINQFGATNSVFSVLLDVNGRVLKMWPGYSKSILKDMNAFLAKAAGVGETPFDPQYAPDAKTSGCPFSEPTPPKKA